MNFKELWLIEPILNALTKQGYETPTPIQQKAIPFILDGKDVFGCAQTGTGKTAAFTLPLIQTLHKRFQANGNAPKYPRDIQALIVTPTRELAIQIWENIQAYAQFTTIKYATIFGGVSQGSQVKSIRAWVDILVATPGRLLDLINQKVLNISSVNVLVLDEADRMLDMWFINDIKKIIKIIPIKRQTLFFSATMPSAILKLAQTMLKDPVSVEVTPTSSTVDTVAQSLYTVSKENKKDLLLHLLKGDTIKNAVVFTKTKHGANKVEKFLAQAKIPSAAIHGNKSQNARQHALENLKKGSIRVLVATDIAARGIDIDELSHVIIHDVPLEPEAYVHRIGRTGRAGLQGTSIMFCDPDEMKYLHQITKLINKPIPHITDHPFHQAHSGHYTHHSAHKTPRANNKSKHQRRWGER